MIALSKNNFAYQCFSLDTEQADVINHLNGNNMGEKRNVLVESARIARGNVKDVSELDINAFDAVFIPGGFGVAKNFCNFAYQGDKLTVNQKIEEVLLKFHKSKKPIAACCISPIVIAKVFATSKDHAGVKLTLGSKGESWPFSDSIKVAADLGNNLVLCDINEVCIDSENKIVTTPAYMKGDANAGEVYNGIEKLVKEAIKLI